MICDPIWRSLHAERLCGLAMLKRHINVGFSDCRIFSGISGTLVISPTLPRVAAAARDVAPIDMPLPDGEDVRRVPTVCPSMALAFLMAMLPQEAASLIESHRPCNIVALVPDAVSNAALALWPQAARPIGARSNLEATFGVIDTHVVLWPPTTTAGSSLPVRLPVEAGAHL